MAKTKISEFSTTAGNNTDINSINIAEGCAPSGINDAIRELMRQLKEFQTGGAGDSVNSGGDFSVATNKFTVASASGNTAVAGTLAVTGTTTLTGALVANGNATLGDGSGDTVTVKGTPTLEVNPTLSGGTANGVLYLNGSKVATSGSALTFDGAQLGVNGVTVGRGAGAVSTNTAVGASALYSNTTGVYNTALGYLALNANTDNSANTAIGYHALFLQGAGVYQNTAVGADAGQANTTGVNLTAIGRSALFSNTTGTSNTAVGTLALNSNTTASNNTAVGYQAAYSNTTGAITAIGSGALKANTTANENTAVGNSAAFSNTTGYDVSAFGHASLYANTTGAALVGIGDHALQANTTGNYNTALGSYALQANTTASNNTAVGYQAGYSNTTGADNTLIGYLAGDSITTGNRNVVVGRSADTSAVGGIDQIVIGYAAIGKGNDTFFENATNSYNGGNTSTWSTTSDQRLKKNIVDNNDGLAKINAIRVRNFEYRLPEEVDAELKPTDAIKKSGVQLGVIAQELQQVLPECVKEESTGVLSVDPDNLTWYMVNAIKELKSELDSVKAELATLKGN